MQPRRESIPRFVRAFDSDVVSPTTGPGPSSPDSAAPGLSSGGYHFPSEASHQSSLRGRSAMAADDTRWGVLPGQMSMAIDGA